MEKLFQYFARASASFVLVILLSTLVVLYINAKPAIDEYGLHFIIDTRWGVEVPITDSSSNTASTQNKGHNPVATSPTISTANGSSTNLLAGADSTQHDQSLDSLDDFSNLDETIPTDDEVGDGTANPKTRTIYGGAVPIIGSLCTIIIAMVLSIPVALGIAVFLSEIAPERLSKPVGIAIELLAAIPSIIYGMWALFYMGPMVSHYIGGHSVSLLVAGMVLGVMVIPFMAALSRDAINTTPDVLKESAYSMGATKFEVVKDIIFPYAKSGIVGSIIVSFGRGIGETMAVAFVIGGVFQIVGKVTDPTNSIPVVLANNFAESSGLSMSVLYYLALILFIVSFSIIFLAKYFLLRRK